MANRTPEKQTKHDKKVEEQANYYVRKEYKVWADLKGWGMPAKRNGFRPDVVAKSNVKEIIVEVETEDSINSDKDQISAFREYAKSRPNVEFKLVMA